MLLVRDRFAVMVPRSTNEMNPNNTNMVRIHAQRVEQVKSQGSVHYCWVFIALARLLTIDK